MLCGGLRLETELYAQKNTLLNPAFLRGDTEMRPEIEIGDGEIVLHVTVRVPHVAECRRKAIDSARQAAW